MRYVYAMHRTDPDVAGSWLPKADSTFLVCWSDPVVSLAYATFSQPDEVEIVVARAPARTLEASTDYEGREEVALRALVLPALRSILGEEIKLVIVPAWSTRAAAEALVRERDQVQREQGH